MQDSSGDSQLSIEEKDNDELLISLIKDRPWIYNLTLKDHKDTIVLENSWQEIACAMQDSVDNCKKRWSDLLKLYNAEKKLIDLETRSGSGASTRTIWPLFNTMKSLFTFEKSRKSYSSFSTTPNISMTKSKNLNVDTVKNQKENSLKFTRSKPQDAITKTLQKTESAINSIMHTFHNQALNNTQVSKKIPDEYDLIGQLITYKLNQMDTSSAKKAKKRLIRCLDKFDDSDEDDSEIGSY